MIRVSLTSEVFKETKAWLLNRETEIAWHSNGSPIAQLAWLAYRKRNIPIQLASKEHRYKLTSIDSESDPQECRQYT